MISEADCRVLCSRDPFRVETGDSESLVNFVEGGIIVEISLRLLDCGRRLATGRARSGRLELNDGRRHLENSRQSLVRFVTDSECGSATSLSWVVVVWFGEEGGKTRGRARDMSWLLTELFLLASGTQHQSGDQWLASGGFD